MTESISSDSCEELVLIESEIEEVSVEGGHEDTNNDENKNDKILITRADDEEDAKTYKEPKESESKGHILSETEEILYDRQIRLWGIEAQRRIMRSKVLFLGKNGVHEETMKNLILAGMGVTLANIHKVTEQDVKSSFFLRTEDIGMPHAEALIQRMQEMTTDRDNVNAINERIVFEDDKSANFDIELKFISKFDVVCVAIEDFSLHKLVLIDAKCRGNNIAFFASVCNGTQGLFFTDLNEHRVMEKFSKASGTCIVSYRSLKEVLEEPKFPSDCDQAVKDAIGLIFLRMRDSEPPSDSQKSLSEVCDLFGADESRLRSILQMYGRTFPVTCGIMGGYLALEIRKFVTKQHETIPNFCVFDMDTSCVTTAML